ncbi:MAG: hypothetical protein U1F37_16925 [Alphaproteobacteria bacterium]
MEPAIREALAARAAGKIAVVERRRDPYPLAYACPIAVAIDGATGERIAMTEIAQPWAGAVAG